MTVVSHLVALAVPTALASGLFIAGISPPSLGAGSAPECRIQRSVAAEANALTVRVRSGALCPLSVRWSGARIVGVEIAKAPDAGLALAGGHADVVYRSYRGFHGTDAFEIATRESSSGATTRTRISVLVE